MKKISIAIIVILGVVFHTAGFSQNELALQLIDNFEYELAAELL